MMALKAGRFILKYEVINMIMLDMDDIYNVLLREFRNKRDFTVRAIDNAKQTALMNDDQDIIFRDLSRSFLHDFELILSYTKKILKLTHIEEFLAEDDTFIQEIAKSQELYKFLKDHTNSVREFQQARKELIKWIIE